MESLNISDGWTGPKRLQLLDMSTNTGHFQVAQSQASGRKEPGLPGLAVPSQPKRRAWSPHVWHPNVDLVGPGPASQEVQADVTA